ncbi:MAG: glycosyltransferase family 2 protein [Gillisia sp.]
MTIAVVILNWNGLQLLKQFLPDVCRFSEKATIYVADNASTDSSVAYVQENFPAVKIIQNAVNGGFAKGYNDALAHLSEDIFILLNSDVQVTPHWLDAFDDIFNKDEKVACIQPKILDFKNPSKFEYAGAAGGFLDKFGYPYCRGRIFEVLEEDTGQYNNETDIFWASGACLAIRGKVYFEAGGLDEDYFAHQEEIDLCWRINNLGYKIVFTPNSSVFHVGGGTLDSLNPRKTYYNFRNSLYNLVKNVPSHQLVSTLLLRMLLDGVAGIQFLVSLKFNHFLAVLRAHLDFYSHLPELLQKRKEFSKKHTYYRRKSIIFDRYIRGITKYSDL